MPEAVVDVARDLWQQWQQGQQPDLAAFLAQAGSLDPLELAAVLRVDQRQRWEISERIPAEHYLQAYPAVAEDAEAAVDIVYAEFLLRQEQEEAASPAEFIRRFPRFAEQLRVQLEFGEALAGDPLPSSSPQRTQPLLSFKGGPTGQPTFPGYRVLRTLGRGGMGIVYEGRQISPPRPVAIKMILGGCQPSSEELARFRAEAEAIARVNHPNIVQIYEVGEHEGRPFFSLELVDGVTLAARTGAVPQRPADAARLVETLARAIHHIHQCGLVHRDLKPENILLRSDGTPKITDFGLARFLDSAARLTQPRDVLGTPCYMSPEQASGLAHVAGPASDVYGLGAILYFLLTTRPPFLGTTALQTIEQVRSLDPTPPRRSHPACPRDLEIICLKCLRKDPDKRYASAAELADDLQRFHDGQPIQARPTPRWERLLKWCRRRPTAASLVGVTVALVLLATISVTAAHMRERQHRDALRRDAETALDAAREAADRNQWSETDVHLENVLKWTATEPSLADLQTRATRLQMAHAHFRQFQQQRDDALFQGVYRALFAGQERVPPVVPAEMADDLSALLSERQRAEMAIGRDEMLLVQADVEAQCDDGADDTVRRQQAGRALAMLDRAAATLKQQHAYHLRRAHYLEVIGADRERQQEQTRLAALPPVSALDHFLTGVHLYQQGELGKAIPAFETAVRQQPDHFWSQFFLAASQLRLRNWVAAEYALNACERQRPDFVWTRLLRGFAEVELSKFDAAEQDLHQAESALKHPAGAATSPAPLDRRAGAVLAVYRGILCLRREQPARAVAHFRNAIQQQPSLYQAHAALVRVYVDQNQLDEADRCFPALAALHPPAVVVADYHTQRARQLARLGKNRPALDACDAAVAAWPEDSGALAIRGQVLLQLADYKNAAASFDRYLELQGPPLADVFRGRGQARMKLGAYLDAADDYTRALALLAEPATPAVGTGASGLRAEFLAHRGWAYFFSKAYPFALRDFEDARRLLPAVADPYIGSGLSRVMLGNYRDALADAQAALRLPATSPEMMFNVACIYSLAAGQVRADATRADRVDLEVQYRKEAVARIRSALGMVPAEQRPHFWATVCADDALDPIRASAEFAQLEKEHSLSVAR